MPTAMVKLFQVCLPFVTLLEHFPPQRLARGGLGEKFSSLFIHLFV